MLSKVIDERGKLGVIQSWPKLWLDSKTASDCLYFIFPIIWLQQRRGPKSSVTQQEEDSNPLLTAVLQCHAGNILQYILRFHIPTEVNLFLYSKNKFDGYFI